jgi:hypothetical protein
MAVHKCLAPVLFALALAGCAELTAEQPLFSVADQGPPPLTEGVWIGVGEGCAERHVRLRRFPSDCTPLDIRRQDDGSWRVAVRVDLVFDLSARERAEAAADPANGPYRVILAPAVERDIGEGYAPLYLGEVAATSGERSSVAYALVAPIGSMPATEMHMTAMISCEQILRDGPIEGVSPRYETRTDAEGESRQELSGCVASTRGAVREAARRAVIESLDELTDRRYVFVRAN